MTKQPSKQRRWQIAHAAKGLCILCNRKRVNANHCEHHRKISAKAALARYYKRTGRKPKKKKV